MRAGWNMVERLYQLGVAGAAQSHRALAVLGRLDSVDLLQRASRARNWREIFVYQSESFLFVKLSGNKQHGVIGLIVVAVERLQPFDWYIFNVTTRTNRGLSIVMPEVRRSHRPFQQHQERVVLAKFKLVTNDRHLAVQISLGDK